jgi:hypothetical protein
MLFYLKVVTTSHGIIANRLSMILHLSLVLIGVAEVRRERPNDWNSPAMSFANLTNSIPFGFGHVAHVGAFTHYISQTVSFSQTND